jgi:hypothetical protein
LKTEKLSIIINNGYTGGKISSLESEIEGYKSELKDPAATKVEKSQLRGLITSARETLNRWLDEKKEKALQFAGELICCSPLPVRFANSLMRTSPPLFSPYIHAHLSWQHWHRNFTQNFPPVFQCHRLILLFI